MKNKWHLIIRKSNIQNDIEIAHDIDYQHYATKEECIKQAIKAVEAIRSQGYSASFLIIQSKRVFTDIEIMGGV